MDSKDIPVVKSIGLRNIFEKGEGVREKMNLRASAKAVGGGRIISWYEDE